jgi:hypothetical protein
MCAHSNCNPKLLAERSRSTPALVMPAVMSYKGQSGRGLETVPKKINCAKTMRATAVIF